LNRGGVPDYSSDGGTQKGSAVKNTHRAFRRVVVVKSEAGGRGRSETCRDGAEAS